MSDPVASPAAGPTAVSAPGANDATPLPSLREVLELLLDVAERVDRLSQDVYGYLPPEDVFRRQWHDWRNKLRRSSL